MQLSLSGSLKFSYFIVFLDQLHTRGPTGGFKRAWGA